VTFYLLFWFASRIFWISAI
jgi:hypothetical protein